VGIVKQATYAHATLYYHPLQIGPNILRLIKENIGDVDTLPTMNNHFLCHVYVSSQKI